jgi:hypothetical protein
MRNQRVARFREPSRVTLALVERDLDEIIRHI